MANDQTGSYSISYYVAGALLIVAIVLVRTFKAPKKA
jgi:hypothetical protein